MATAAQSVLSRGLKMYSDILLSQNDIKTFCDSMPDMIVACDNKWNIIFANQLFLSFFGFTHNDIYHKSIQAIFPLHNIRIKADCFQYRSEWIEVVTKPLIINEQSLNVIFLHVISPSTIDTLNHGASRQSKSDLYTKNKFVATVSHEMRTPLNAIVGFADLLSEGIFSTNQIKNYSNLILRNAESLLSLVNEILDFSKLSSNQYVAKKEEFILDDVARTIHSNFQKMAEDKGLEFYLWIKVSNQKIVSDSHIIRQIIVNLIGNAIKFTDTGSIFLILDKQDNNVVIRVKDTGIGIDEKNINDLFVEFQQLDANNGRYYEGTGLGLSIVKRFVDLLKGRIEVQSVPKVGSTFSIIIPSN